MFLKNPKSSPVVGTAKAEQQNVFALRKVKNLLEDENASPAGLYVAASQILTQEELTTFSPYTIRLELQDELGIKFLNPDIFGKLLAFISAVGTDLFYKDIGGFIEICNVLAGSPPLPGVWDPATVEEIAYAISQVQLIDLPDDPETGDFNEEIRAYMGMMLKEQGFFSVPKVLQMAIMPAAPNTPVDVEADLLPGVIESDSLHQQDIEIMLKEELAATKEEIISIIGLERFKEAFKP